MPLNSDSPTFHKTITPDSNTDLVPQPRTLMVVVTGNVHIIDDAGISIVYPSQPVGPLPFSPKRIGASTTATIVGWYNSNPAG